MADEERVEVHRSLYGSPDGLWAILDAPLNTISPPSIVVGVVPGRLVELTDLGDPTDVIRRVYERLKVHPRAGAQEAIARLLGVKQQTVSRHIAGTGDPETPPAGWGALVRVYLAGVERG